MCMRVCVHVRMYSFSHFYLFFFENLRNENTRGNRIFQRVLKFTVVFPSYFSFLPRIERARACGNFKGDNRFSLWLKMCRNKLIARDKWVRPTMKTIPTLGEKRDLRSCEDRLHHWRDKFHGSFDKEWSINLLSRKLMTYFFLFFIFNFFLIYTHIFICFFDQGSRNLWFLLRKK